MVLWKKVVCVFVTKLLLEDTYILCLFSVKSQDKTRTVHCSLGCFYMRRCLTSYKQNSNVNLSFAFQMNALVSCRPSFRFEFRWKIYSVQSFWLKEAQTVCVPIWTCLGFSWEGLAEKHWTDFCCPISFLTGAHGRRSVGPGSSPPPADLRNSERW